jgi:predicted small lipoprotein YifL
MRSLAIVRTGRTVALIVAASMVGGCGQRGPLVLPKPPEQPVARPASPQQTAPDQERAQRRPAM